MRLAIISFAYCHKMLKCQSVGHVMVYSFGIQLVEFILMSSIDCMLFQMIQICPRSILSYSGHSTWSRQFCPQNQMYPKGNLPLQLGSPGQRLCSLTATSLPSLRSKVFSKDSNSQYSVVKVSLLSFLIQINVPWTHWFESSRNIDQGQWSWIVRSIDRSNRMAPQQERALGQDRRAFIGKQVQVVGPVTAPYGQY